jgi:CrcB protein
MTERALHPVGPSIYGAILLVGLGGAAGANARYLLGREVSERWPSVFPWGTLFVNATGCLALGVLIGWLLARGDRPVARLLIATGFLGAYTTFSTFAYESVRLLEDGRLATAIAYIVTSLALCLGSAAGGIRLGRAALAA